MKKNVFALFLLCPILIAAIEPALKDAKNMADMIYSKIYETVRDKEEHNSLKDYTNMYGLTSDGKLMYEFKYYPNDIYLLSGNEGKKSLTPDSYFREIEDFVGENDVSFSYDVMRTEFCKQQELRKNEDYPKFAKVTVKKEWVVNGKTYIIIDEVQINLTDNNVSNITNEFVSIEDCNEETLDDMLAKAALFYDKADYSKAVALYEKILEKYPDNDDAWYNLGVMYFKMQGVGKLSKKQRLDNAYICWKHSNLKKASRAISYITDGRE